MEPNIDNVDPEMVAKIVKTHVLPMFRGTAQKRVNTNNSALTLGGSVPQLNNTVQSELKLSVKLQSQIEAQK